MKIAKLAAALFAIVAALGAETNVVDPLKLNQNTMRRLEAAKRTQLNELARSRVDYRFGFSNIVDRTGITFRHEVVDDAAKNWKPAHYDHGTAVAVADVDSDGLLDLYFVNQLGRNELWRNLGGARFENATEQAGVGMDREISVAAAFADLDNDNRPDLLVTTVLNGTRLYRNLGGGRFEDASAGCGLTDRAHASSMAVFDYDNDGLLDVFICNVGNYTLPEKGVGGFFLAYLGAFKAHLEPDRSERSRLYKNLGGLKFREVSEEANVRHTGWTGEATFGDVNDDGRMDLYVLNMQGDDKLYVNQGGKFVEDTARYFPKTPWGAMGVKFFDYNLDGRFDLYLTDMHSDMTEVQTKAGKREYSRSFEKAKSEPWCSIEWTDAFLQGASNNIFGNALYANRGAGVYEEVSQAAGVETYWPWGPSVGDLNADGAEDIFVTGGMGYPFRYGINSVLLNDDGRRFAEAEFALGVEPRQAGIEIEYFTLDCSGADKDHAICRHKKGIVKVIGSTSSRSSAIADFDNDGDLDIVTNDMNDRPQFLQSNLAQRGPFGFLKVVLRGAKSNRDGLGARVRLTAGGKTQHRFHDGKSGYLAQSSMPLYFGLGSATNIEKLEVTWPSGLTQTIATGLAPNQSVLVEEPGR